MCLVVYCGREVVCREDGGTKTSRQSVARAEIHDKNLAVCGVDESLERPQRTPSCVRILSRRHDSVSLCLEFDGAKIDQPRGAQPCGNVRNASTCVSDCILVTSERYATVALECGYEEGERGARDLLAIWMDWRRALGALFDSWGAPMNLKLEEASGHR